MNPRSNFTTNQLIHNIQKEIPDVSEVYNREQLSMMYEAIHGKDYIIPISNREAVVIPKKEKQAIQIDPTHRKKVRIDLTIDNSFAEPLLEHLKQFENLQVNEIKTGLAVKNVYGGYMSNIVNYNELRTINGVLYGNLYFNVIRSEEDFECLGIDRDIKWFRGFVQIQKVSIYDVIEYLNEEVVVFLKNFNKRSNKRRLHNASKLIKST